MNFVFMMLVISVQCISYNNKLIKTMIHVIVFWLKSLLITRIFRLLSLHYAHSQSSLVHRKLCPHQSQFSVIKFSTEELELKTLEGISKPLASSMRMKIRDTKNPSFLFKWKWSKRLIHQPILWITYHYNPLGSWKKQIKFIHCQNWVKYSIWQRENKVRCADSVEVGRGIILSSTFQQIFWCKKIIGS